MKHRQMLTGTAASIGILIMILDGKTAVAGAQEGISLCLKTVIPSLFPFFVLSVLLTNSLTGTSLQFLTPLRKLCSLPKGTESILLSAFLGGYPAGAQSISIAYSTGHLSKEEAERMLGFCNNAGPAFLFGMVSFMFPEKRLIWMLWGIHVVSAILTARFLPSGRNSSACTFSGKHISYEVIPPALRIMATVCSWIVLFRVVIAFLSRWFLWYLPAEIQVLLVGILELSNGCCQLPLIENISVRFILCSVMLSLGGVCVAMQTHSAVNGLSLRCYFLGKGIQTVLSLAFSIVMITGKWYLVVLFVFLLGILPAPKKKEVAIPA